MLLKPAIRHRLNYHFTTAAQASASPSRFGEAAHVNMCIYIYIYIYIYIHTYIYIYIYTHIYIYIHTYTHLCITYIYMHMHTHTYALPLRRGRAQDAPPHASEGQGPEGLGGSVTPHSDHNDFLHKICSNGWVAGHPFC